MLWTFFVCAQNKFVRILPSRPEMRKKPFLLYKGVAFCGHFWFCGLSENTLLQNTLFTVSLFHWICSLTKFNGEYAVYTSGELSFIPFFYFSKNNENSASFHVLCLIVFCYVNASGVNDILKHAMEYNNQIIAMSNFTVCT